MARWHDRFWNSPDGIKLHYRDHDGPHDRPPILCIPGLTRNAADFEPVADHVAGAWRLISVDLRGRGMSANDPNPSHYSPPYYTADILKLLDQLGIADAVFVGTSLGGLVTMLIAATDEERIAGALLNDIGPEIDRAGLERIGSYVGKDRRFGSWKQAAAELAERHGAMFPDWGAAEWERYARRVGREEGGTVGFAYDMAIADKFHAAMEVEPVDAWPFYRALAGRPVAVLRGGLSDLLSEGTAERMATEVPGADIVTVPRVGHAPSLEEPESLAALDRLLERVLARA